jgi:WD40 repeat protein
VVARADGSVVLLELWPIRERVLCTLEDEPTALAMSMDNSLVAVATCQGRIELRLLETSKLISSFSTEEKPTAVAVSPDAVAVGTAKGTIDVWTLPVSGRASRYSRAHTYQITQIAFSHDGVHVVSADNLHIKEWSLQASSKQEIKSCPSPASGEVKVTSDGRNVVAVLEDGRLGVWNLHTGSLESILPHPNGPLFGDTEIGTATRIALATEGPQVLAWNEKLLCVWNLHTRGCVGTLRADDIHGAAINADGAGVAYIDGLNVSFWSPLVGNSRVLGKYVGDRPGYVAVSPNGRFALSSGGDRQVHLWRLTGPPNPYLERIRSTMEELGGRHRNSFDPDASCWPPSPDKPSLIAFVGQTEAIVTTGDGSLFVVDIHDEPSERPRLEASRIQGDHFGGVFGILVHPQRKLLVTSSYNGSVKVWDLASRCCSAVLNAHPGTVQQVSASAERILLNTRDGVVNLVDVSDEALVAAFQGDKQFVSSDADAELRYVVTLDQGGQIHFLRLEPDQTQAK